jgi:thioredoxin reductase
MGLAHQKGNKVTLSYRKDEFSRIKERNAQRIKECVDARLLEVCFNSAPVEIKDNVVVLEVEGSRRELKNDFTWVFAGGIPPNAFLEKVGVVLGPRDLTKEAQTESRARTSAG